MHEYQSPNFTHNNLGTFTSVALSTVLASLDVGLLSLPVLCCPDTHGEDLCLLAF